MNITSQEVIRMNRNEFLIHAKKVMSVPAPKAKSKRLNVEFPYDLRASMDMKTFDASDKCNWTAFVNRTGTLVHVVSPTAELLIRLKFPESIDYLNTVRMADAIQARIGEWVRI